MTYIRVRWIHSFPDEPVMLYSELDDDRWETRKVEVFPDGHRGYADASEEVGGTHLSELPLPALEEIAADPEFEVTEIARDEFEEVWRGRTS